MVPMTLAQVQYEDSRLRTTVILVDQTRQHALLLWFRNEPDFSSQLRMFASTEQQAAVTELPIADFFWASSRRFEERSRKLRLSRCKPTCSLRE